MWMGMVDGSRKSRVILIIIVILLLLLGRVSPSTPCLAIDWAVYDRSRLVCYTVGRRLLRTLWLSTPGIHMVAQVGDGGRIGIITSWSCT